MRYQIPNTINTAIMRHSMIVVLVLIKKLPNPVKVGSVDAPLIRLPKSRHPNPIAMTSKSRSHGFVSKLVLYFI
jgi:hypothetical protein